MNRKIPQPFTATRGKPYVVYARSVLLVYMILLLYAFNTLLFSFDSEMRAFLDSF